SFVGVYYGLIDTSAHLFVADRHLAEPAIRSAYRELDEAIAATARALDPETLLLVVSDHGFYSPAAGISDNPADLTAGAAAWHRPHGIAAATTAGALAGTRPAPRLAALGEVTPLDVAPTVLARAGLAVAEDMPGRVLTALASGVQNPKIVSYGLHRVPDAVPGAGARTAGAELQRLRALGYVSGSAAVT